MSFRIQGPNVIFNGSAGQQKILRVVGYTSDGRRIAISEFLRIPRTSMALFPGYIIAREGNEVREAEEIVVKISPNKAKDKHLLAEKRILQKLSGRGGIPEVVAEGRAWVSFWEFDGKDSVGKVKRKAPFFVMPRMAGKNLSDFRLRQWRGKPPKREEVALLVAQAFPLLAERLGCLHQRDVVHRDVKPDNVLFDNQTRSLSLLDFGSANWLNADPRTDFSTFFFFPPELMLERPPYEDVRTDVYELGVTCFTVLTGKKAVLFRGMENPTRHTPLDYFMGHVNINDVSRQYYEAIRAHASLGIEQLVAKSNLPAQLKQTPLGRYLLKLSHPDKKKRPYNMRRIASNLRRLGGQLLQHEIWDRPPSAG